MRFVTLLLAALLAAGCVQAPEPPEIDAVFLIVVDTLRPDRLSCYGYEEHETPAIDRLASAGVRFERAQSVASWTVPSMGALHTSRYPLQLGLIEYPDDAPKTYAWREKRRQLHYTLKQHDTLAGMLDDSGYYPVAFVNQPFINVSDGFLRGFAEWCHTVREDSVRWHDVSGPLPDPTYPEGTDLGNADVHLAEAFETWLSANADLKPFAWIHLLKPHYPYTPLLRMLPEDQRHPDAVVPTDERYAAEVREVDETVGFILDAIDEHVGLDRSLVIFTSDHGEELGEHGMGEHGHSLHREVVHVPLIIAGPSIPAGGTVSAYARLIDILPTALSIVGASERVPEWAEGVDLVPLIRGRKTSLPVYAEGMLYGSTERSVIADEYKLMFDAQTEPSYRLFNTEFDPLERQDVAAAQPERVERMKASLQARFDRSSADYAERAGQAAVTGSDPETERILKAMRALGYVNE